jgi:hypothetical protein
MRTVARVGVMRNSKNLVSQPQEKNFQNDPGTNLLP